MMRPNHPLSGANRWGGDRSSWLGALIIALALAGLGLGSAFAERAPGPKRSLSGTHAFNVIGTIRRAGRFSHPLGGTYAFSVIGTALLAPQGSGTPSLVPAAISGTIVVAEKYDVASIIGGAANVDIGGLACNAEGPGPAKTAVGGAAVLFAGGDHVPLGPAPYAVGSFGVSTSAGVPPAGIMPTSCVEIGFYGPVTGSPTGAAGFVLTGDPDSSHLNISLQYGTGTIQGQAVTDLTAIGWAARVPAGTGTGGTEP